MKRICILLVALVVSSTVLSQNKIDTYITADSLLSTDKLETAEEYLILLSSDNPYNGGYQYSLGKIYNKLKEFRKSTTHLKKAQELGIFYRSNYYLACNYIGIGNLDSALYYLEEHMVTPMNGQHPNEDPLADSAFIALHNHAGYLSLLPPKIDDSTNTIENWITDIDYFSAMLKKTYYDPFYKIDESTWDNIIEKLKKDVPTLKDEEIIVRLSQFLALMGDGHMNINDHFMPGKRRFQSKKLPITTKLFSDGCYIIGASEKYKGLLGAKIIKVNDVDFAKVFDTISTTISVDNEMGYKFLFNSFFRKMNILHGLGLSNSTNHIDIEYVIDGKKEKDTIFSVEDNSDFPELIRYHTYFEKEYPMFLNNYRKGNIKWYWFKFLEDEKILYVQINGITSLPDNPLPKFCDSINDLINNNDLLAFVLDIRNNGGGNSNYNINILELMLTKKINIKGKSFTVIGPNTFSAAQNLTNIIENYTETIFIGEPTGSSPNFIGEISPFKLPYSGLVINSSNIYHQNGYSSDTRNWVPPDIYVDFTFEQFENGIDPIMEELIEFTEKRE